MRNLTPGTAPLLAASCCLQLSLPTCIPLQKGLLLSEAATSHTRLERAETGVLHAAFVTYAMSLISQGRSERDVTEKHYSDSEAWRRLAKPPDDRHSGIREVEGVGRKEKDRKGRGKKAGVGKKEIGEREERGETGEQKTMYLGIREVSSRT